MRCALILLFLTACSTPCQPPPAAPVIGWIDGEQFPIAESWVLSEDNENVHWSAMLESSRAFPQEFSSDLRAASVEIGGARHAVTGIGGSPGGGVFFHIQSDRAGAMRLAAALGVPANPRRDPGCVLRARIIPARELGPPGEPQLAGFELTNSGPLPVAFTRRGSGLSSHRDEDFEVQVVLKGLLQPCLTAAADWGGLRQRVTLAPGASTVFELNLAAWANFDAREQCQIQVRYHLVAEPPDRFALPVYASAHQLWDVTVLAESDLRID